MNPVYVVTDVELDGPTSGENSMLASVAVDAGMQEVDTFEAVLAPLVGAAPDPPTMAWFRSQPEAFAAATQNSVLPYPDFGPDLTKRRTKTSIKRLPRIGGWML